jgi:ABC-type Zn uptake system ZnuABC Zn-binding protein ZnuA
MASQQKGPGGHYSGHNPIPTVRQFVENLDKDKKNRDAEIDAQGGTKPAKAPATAQGGVQDHKVQSKTVEGTEKTVTDPTTGREVVIADVGPEMVNEVENPHVWTLMDVLQIVS